MVPSIPTRQPIERRVRSAELLDQIHLFTHGVIDRDLQWHLSGQRLSRTPEAQITGADCHLDQIQQPPTLPVHLPFQPFRQPAARVSFPIYSSPFLPQPSSNQHRDARPLHIRPVALRH